ncbi:MAG: hypothetical protein V7741_00235 [Hyphomonas sp.]
MTPQDQFEQLRQIYPSAEFWTEGGQPFVYLPGFRLKSGRKTVALDALLCPQRHASASYPTRLFLSDQPPHGGQNWNSFQLFGRSWRACSWDKVPDTLGWPNILASHLRAFA